MSNARNYLLTVDDDIQAANLIVHTTVQDLQSHQTTLIDVVQSLAEYINDGDEKIRSKAVSYLTAVIAALPPQYLSRQQIQVLCQFLCDRVEDGGAIEGLSRLQSLDRFNSAMAQNVVRALFERFSDLQSRTQSARHRILQLLTELMFNHRKALLAMGDESLTGITELVSGEKDPRNLMLIFSMLRAIMVEWDITSWAETMFDSVYAYFPITFRPPPNDPYGITAQDLKDRLRDCISSTPVLAPYAIPNMLDKLDSTSPVVKRDVLQTLLACAKVYDPPTMSHYSVTLWDALKFEILSAQEPELAEETLPVLREIAYCLSRSTNTSPTSSPLAQYLRPITKECIEHLQEPAQRQAKAAGDILKAVSSANLTTFIFVVRSVIAPMATIYQSVDGIIKQRGLLEVINQLFDSAISVLGTWRTPVSEVSYETENPLEPFKDRFLEIYSQAMMRTMKEEVSFRVTAARGLLLLSKMRKFLNDGEIGLVVQHYNEIVIHEESYGRDELKRTAMQGLAEISANKPMLIMDITFPAFMARLPDTGAEADRTNTYRMTLEGLSEISVEKDVAETLVRRLLNKIDVLLQDNQGSVPYTSAILSTVYYVLDQGPSPQSLDIYFDRVVVGLSRRIVSDLTSGRPSILCDMQVLQLLARIITLIIRRSSKKSHACENIYSLFTDGVDLSVITRAHASGEVQRTATLQSSDRVGDLSNLMILSTSLLAAMPRDQISDATAVRNKLHTLVEYVVRRSSQVESGTSFTDPVQVATLRQVALYINKHLPSSNLEASSDLLDLCRKSLPRAGLSGTPWLRLVFTIAKALVLRVAPSSRPILTDLMSLLQPKAFVIEQAAGNQLPENDRHIAEKASRVAASGFGSILAPDEVVSKANYAQIRLLAPQHVLQTVVPLISTRFKESSSALEKENCLVALSGIISSVPAELVLPELPTLLPLLLQSLDLPDQPTVKIATLETWAIIIATSPAALEESGHVAALVRRLINAAVGVKSSSIQSHPVMAVKPADASQQKPSPQKFGASTKLFTNPPRARQLATRCLFLMPSHVSGGGLRPNPLLTLKSAVLLGLRKVLDDPKRDVRTQAVDARAAWIRGVDDLQEDDSD